MKAKRAPGSQRVSEHSGFSLDIQQHLLPEILLPSAVVG